MLHLVLAFKINSISYFRHSYFGYKLRLKVIALSQFLNTNMEAIIVGQMIIGTTSKPCEWHYIIDGINGIEAM